jgi:hypothetical protein
MAVNELDRDYLRLIHMIDMMENVQNGMKMENETDSEKKKQVGNIVMHLEEEMLDSRYEDGGKDVSVINAAITAGRTYWKS